MDTIQIKQFYDYNRWANARVLEAVAKITPEQYAKDLGNSFPSIRDTLTHIMSAEWIWHQRWLGTSPKAMRNTAEFPDLDALKTAWSALERAQMAFIRELTNEALQTVIAYTNTRGEAYQYPLWQMMQHVVNHSTYHRGQITTMLRQLGAQPVGTDLLLFQDRLADRR